MAQSDKELSTPEKREKKLKDYYKKLPLFKVKDILLGIKRKSQVYKDMGQKVPKNLISIQRSLYYIIKKKEEEQMEKAKQTANTVNESIRLAGLAKGFVSEKSLGKENPKNLKLEGTDLHDLWFDGTLNLEGSNISSLPNGMTIGGDLILKGIKEFSKLPDNLTVHADLDASDTNISEIPKNLKVDNVFDFSLTPLSEELYRKLGDTTSVKQYVAKEIVKRGGKEPSRIQP
jgi:hypothetical protein